MIDNKDKRCLYMPKNQKDVDRVVQIIKENRKNGTARKISK